MGMQSGEIPPDFLDQVQDLYNRGLFLQAYDAAKELGPLPTWQGAEATVLASRLASQLGGSILARWLIRRAWRQYPNHGLVRYFYAYNVAGSRGAYHAWRFMHEVGEPSDEEPEKLRSDWYASLGMLAANLRDFDTAEASLEKAFALAPSDPWLEVCRATVLEQEDRYEEALALAQHAMELRCWYGPAVESAAHLLTLLDRDDEAVRLLTEASEHIENMRVACQLAVLQTELRQYESAQALLKRCEALAPLAEKPFHRWLASRWSDVAYHLGHVEDAVNYAKQVGPGFYESIAERIENNSLAEPQSVMLPVGFVRQHQMTCVPATLSAISRYWSKPADHLEVAEEICYNGTTAYNERKWAETHGWIAREFTVTEASASALLNRGVPFTLTTTDPANAHLQAVIGYDQCRGTFWIRDPFWRSTGEAIIDRLLEQYRAYGPRGMVLLPLGEQDRLENIDLPDAAWWDRLHAMDAALVDHRREEAQEIYEQLTAESNGHRLSLVARHRLACYDANPAERLVAVEGLLEIAPENPCLHLDRLACLRDLAHRDQSMSVFEELCEKRDAHPVFLQQYAHELQADARRHNEVVSLLERAIRRAPNDAGNYYELAHVRWDQRRFAEAFELYRFATCMNDKDESYADSYFRAARWFKQTETALAFLQRRFQRFGKQSNLPARTLVQAYLQCDRTTEALETLEEAMRLRPEDGELRLFAADMYSACSRENMPIALSLLEKAKGVASQVQWLRTAAYLANQTGKAEEALSLWQQVLERQPLAIDAHQAITQLLLETQGKSAVLSHLTTVGNRFPHYKPLCQLWVQWVQDEPLEVRESVIRQGLTHNPHDAWLHRELALSLMEQRRPAEAWSEIAVAGQLEPNVPVYHFIRALLLRDEGKLEEAKASLHDAIRLSVDYRYAVDELLVLCTSAAERREVLAFVKDELLQQVTFGDGLLAFRNHAHGTLEPEELLSVLCQSLQERPDLWHAWSACIQQLLTLDRREEAWELARKATDRFPLLPALWLDLAATCWAREDRKGEHEAIQTAYQINPDWSDAVRCLADYKVREGEFEQARQLLEQAVIRQPLDANAQVMLAETLWRQKEQEAALEQICHVVGMNPGYDRAWTNLRNWAAEMGRSQVVIDTARHLTERRGGEALSWFLLAESLDDPEQIEERLGALDKATSLNPRFQEAHDLRAIVLASAQRWEEAQQACYPSFWGENPPVELRGRAIWIMAHQKSIREAIPKMRALLASEAGYYTGWCWLWEWYQALKNYSGCMTAAEALVHLNPQSEISLGYLGEAYSLTGNLAKAKKLFQRAFDLNPRYEFAGLGLFDLQVHARQFEKATETLATLMRYSTTPFVQSRAIKLEAVLAQAAMKRGAIGRLSQVTLTLAGKDPGVRQTHQDAAVHYLREVCTSPCDSPWPVAFAVETMIATGWRRTVQKNLSELLYVDGVHEEVGRQWVRLRVGRRRWNCGKQLRELTQQRENIGVETTVFYLDMLIHNDRKSHFNRFLRRHKAWLRKHRKTWEKVAYAMAHFEWSARRYARWMKDWRQHGTDPWILANYVEVLRNMGRDTEAAEVSRHALTLPIADGHDTHRAWLAADAACNGEFDIARSLLAEVRQRVSPDGITFIERLTHSLIEMASAGTTEKSKGFLTTRQNLRIAFVYYGSFKRNPARKRLYRRCIRLVAQHHGHWKAKMWYYWRWILSL